MVEWHKRISLPIWVKQSGMALKKLAIFLVMATLISVLIVLIAHILDVSIPDSQAPWVIALGVIAASTFVTLLLTSDRTKHEKEVERLLKGILMALRSDRTPADQDVHRTMGRGPDNQQVMERVTEQNMGHRQPDNITAGNTDRPVLVYMTFGTVVLVLLALWVASVLSTDNDTWRPILYAWAGIAVVLCFQAAYTEWTLSRQSKEQKARHTEIVCLLTAISRKLGDEGTGDK